MPNFSFTPRAWEHYTYWQKQDRKTLKKINDLIQDIARNGAMQGSGKPEKLKYHPGYSRRISETDRLVYTIGADGTIEIDSCRGHYED